MQINVPSPSLQSLSGYKTYIVLASGAIVIALNHFGLLPPGYVKLDPNDWITEEYQLLLGATGRSAIASLGPVIAKYLLGHPDLLPILIKAQVDAKGINSHGPVQQPTPQFVPGGGGDA